MTAIGHTSILHNDIVQLFMFIRTGRYLSCQNRCLTTNLSAMPLPLAEGVLLQVTFLLFLLPPTFL